MPDDYPKPPKGVGPHNNRELELMLSGEKPLAMFSDLPGPDTVLPTAAFAPYVTSGAIIMATFDELLPDGRTLRHEYYAVPGEEWRIEPAHTLSRKKYDTWCEAADEDCREIGRHGYDEVVDDRIWYVIDILLQPLQIDCQKLLSQK